MRLVLFFSLFFFFHLKIFFFQTQEWEDIDITDREDPLSVAEYVNDVYEFYNEKEVGPFFFSSFLFCIFLDQRSSQLSLHGSTI